MLNKIISFFAKKALSGKVLTAVAWVHNLLDGKRSEIVIVLIAAVYGLKVAQIVPDAAADQILSVLYPILPVTLADRISKIKQYIDDLIPHAQN